MLGLTVYAYEVVVLELLELIECRSERAAA